MKKKKEKKRSWPKIKPEDPKREGGGRGGRKKQKIMWGERRMRRTWSLGALDTEQRVLPEVRTRGVGRF